MKKIISALILITMLLSLISIPASAIDIETGIYVNVKYDKESRMVAISGIAAPQIRTLWLLIIC